MGATPSPRVCIWPNARRGGYPSPNLSMLLQCLMHIQEFLTLISIALQDQIRKIEMKPLMGTTIKAICYKATPCIFIRNITDNYDEHFLTKYFENTIQSGGGEVASVELFGNGEAKVMFKDLKGSSNTSAITIIAEFVNVCKCAHE